MSANKFAGRARRLAVTALAATEHGLSTGIKWRPPSNHPDIIDAEKAGWIKRGSARFGWSRHSRVTVFHVTPAGREALTRFGAPVRATIRDLGPSPKRQHKAEEQEARQRIAMKAIARRNMARLAADPATPAAWAARFAAQA